MARVGGELVARQAEHVPGHGVSSPGLPASNPAPGAYAIASIDTPYSGSFV